MRISESDLVLPALYVISRNPGITTSDLIAELTQILRPSGGDAEILRGRSDTKFSQMVRNLKSHNTLGREGYATYSDGIWHITTAGQAYLDENRENIEPLLLHGFPYHELRTALRAISDETPQKRQRRYVDEEIVIQEGQRININTTSYERSNAVKQAALRRYRQEGGNIRCIICDFDFYETYGERGKDFIVIHHERPLYETEGVERTAFLEQAVEDVKPVCSNCHSMIHRRRNEFLTIDQMRELIHSQ